MAKAPYVFPIVGGRKLDHIKGNIDALNIALDPEDVKEIDDAAPFDLGFPYSFIGTTPGESFLIRSEGHMEYVQPPMPIRPEPIKDEEKK